MNVFICVLILIPLALGNPGRPSRQYYPEEENPDYKRFIYKENDNGDIELIDLREGRGQPSPRLSVSDISYALYTQRNKVTPHEIRNGDVIELEKSYFDPRKVSLFVAHGWQGSGQSEINSLIRDAALHSYDVNVFIIDWSIPASGLYSIAQGSVSPVGEIIGEFISGIQRTYNLGSSAFILSGHSLGAHVVGSAGRFSVNGIAHIIGLDPAGPLFTVSDINHRLDDTDGEFVQIIHTNGALLGFSSSIGHVDHFPNGGSKQPGCGLDLAGSCSHSKAYRYFAESLLQGPVFRAHRCTNYDNYLKGSCAENSHLAMGDLSADLGSIGDYFLDTNSDEPFAKQ